MRGEMITATENTYPIETGDFIEIPAWQTCGLVQSVTGSMYGTSKSCTVLLQEHHEQPARQWGTYRLEPGEYRILE